MTENEKPSGTYSQDVNIDIDVRTAGGPSRSWILDRYPLTNAKEAMSATLSIVEQVIACLDAATHENGYPHEYDRPAEDIVLDIHDWSGIEGFDPDEPLDVAFGVDGVRLWREKNPRD